MLYVFHLEKGYMLTLDLSLRNELVSALQGELENATGTVTAQQILLISGGEILDSSRKVSSYSAGTDTNPIYLVSNLAGGGSSSVLSESARQTLSRTTSSSTPPSDDVLKELESSYNNLKRASLITLETVRNVSAAAVKAADLSSEYVGYCATLVSDNHHIHQGWLAIIVNLEDVMRVYESRVIQFLQRYDRHLSRRDQIFSMLDCFPTDIDYLKRIPLLRCLTEPESVSAVSGAKRGDTVPEEGACPSSWDDHSSGQSLLDWIKSKDNTHDLLDVCIEARTLVEHFGAELADQIRHQFDSLKVEGEKQEMKRIRGVQKRLEHLNTYLARAQEHLNSQLHLRECIANLEQSMMTSAMQDPNIIQDAGRQQIEQLGEMIGKHCKTLLDICRRFFAAKAELLQHLHLRIAWVGQVEQSVQSADGELILYREQLKRLRRTLELLQQIHEAPKVYAAAISEVVRRSSFSRQFLNWANQLTKQVRQLYESEQNMRMTMSTKLRTHFLRQLFPGMQDPLPSFALQPPAAFDQQLPTIRLEHVTYLRNTVPDLSPVLKVCQIDVLEKVLVKRDERFFIGGGPLERKPSFFTHTPPNLQFAKSFPSSSYISGEENLAGFAADLRGSGDVFELEASGSGHQDGSPRLKPAASTDSLSDLPPLPPLPSIPSVGPTRTSAPISIPGGNGAAGGSNGATAAGNNNNMATSRQMSERSSKFGTPEEDIEDGGAPVPAAPGLSLLCGPEAAALIGACHSLNTPESPPEIVSKSQISAEMEEQFSSPLQESKDEEKPPMIVQASRSSPQKFESAPFPSEIAVAPTLQPGEETIVRKEEMDSLRSELQHKDVELQKLHEMFAQVRSAMASASGELKDVFSEIKTALQTEVGDATWVRQCADQVQRFAITEKSIRQARAEEFDRISRERQEFQDEVAVLREQAVVLQGEKESMESECCKTQELCDQGQEEILALQKALKEKDDSCVRDCEAAKAEVVKQLSLASELELEEVRQTCMDNMKAKDAALDGVQQKLNEAESQLAQTKKDCDLAREELVQFRASTVEQSDMELQNLRNELENAVKDHGEQMAAVLCEHQNKTATLEATLAEKDALLQTMEQELSQFRANLHGRTEVATETEPSPLLCDAATDACAVMLEQQEAGTQSPDFEPSTENDQLQCSSAQSSPGKEAPGSSDGSSSPRAEGVEQQSQAETSLAGGGSSNEASVIYSLSRSEYCDASESASEQSQLKALILGSSRQFPPVSSGSVLGGACRNCDKRYLVPVMSIREGDYVLAMYSGRHENYVACCLSKTAHFVTVQDVQDLKQRQKYQCTVQDRLLLGRVKQKEYCLAKKENNRFFLPKGSKFYLLQVDPIGFLPFKLNVSDIVDLDRSMVVASMLAKRPPSAGAGELPPVDEQRAADERDAGETSEELFTADNGSDES